MELKVSILCVIVCVCCLVKTILMHNKMEFTKYCIEGLQKSIEGFLEDAKKVSEGCMRMFEKQKDE